MTARTLAALAAALLALSLAGCAQPSAPEPAPEQPAEQPAESPAAGLRLAPGLYDMPDGTVQAIGTVEYVDLEGGFWAVTDGTKAEGDEGKVVAVVANSDDFEQELKDAEGQGVMIVGKRLDGASIRMAGPEIEVTSIEVDSDTPGIAE